MSAAAPTDILKLSPVSASSDIVRDGSAASKVRTDPDGVFNEIAVGLKKYARLNQKQIEELKENENIVTSKFLYSKLQVTQLINTLESIRTKKVRDQLVEDIYLYASSQSRFSSAYYKLE